MGDVAVIMIFGSVSFIAIGISEQSQTDTKIAMVINFAWDIA